MKKLIKKKKKLRFFRVIFLTILVGGIFIGFRPYVVVSGSMEPTLPTGSIIFVSLLEKKAEPGDILTFRRGKTVVTHRVAEQKDGIYITRGDANKEKDPGIVKQEDVIGVVSMCVPWAGMTVVWIRKYRKLVLIAGAAAFIAAGIMTAGKQYRIRWKRRKV